MTSPPPSDLEKRARELVRRFFHVPDDLVLMSPEHESLASTIIVLAQSIAEAAERAERAKVIKAIRKVTKNSATEEFIAALEAAIEQDAETEPIAP